MPGFVVGSRMIHRPTSRTTNVPEVSFRDMVSKSTQSIFNAMVKEPELARELNKFKKGHQYLEANCFKKIDNLKDGVYISPCMKSVDGLMYVTIENKKIMKREYGGVTLTNDSIIAINDRSRELEKEIENKTQDYNTLGNKVARLEIDKRINCFPITYWQPFSPEEIESKQRVANDIFKRGQYKPLLSKTLSQDKRYYRFCPKSFNGVAELKFWKTISSNELYKDEENKTYYYVVQSYRETDGGGVIEETIALPDLSTVMSRSTLTSYITGKSATVRGGKRTKRKRRSPK